MIGPILSLVEPGGHAKYGGKFCRSSRVAHAGASLLLHKEAKDVLLLHLSMICLSPFKVNRNPALYW